MMMHGVQTLLAFGVVFGSLRQAHCQVLRYEAETATMNNCTVSAQHKGFSGKGYVGFTGQGSWVEWNVEAPTTGDYKLSVQYATVSSCPTHLIVDGISI